MDRAITIRRVSISSQGRKGIKAEVLTVCVSGMSANLWILPNQLAHVQRCSIVKHRPPATSQTHLYQQHTIILPPTHSHTQLYVCV